MKKDKKQTYTYNRFNCVFLEKAFGWMRSSLLSVRTLQTNTVIIILQDLLLYYLFEAYNVKYLLSRNGQIFVLTKRKNVRT